MNRDELTTFMHEIEVCYEKFSVNTNLIDSWFRVLNRFSFADAMAALDGYRVNDKRGFAPNVGVLIAYMPQAGETRTTEDRAANVAARMASGLVPTFMKADDGSWKWRGWERPELCKDYGGIWLTKMEYCCAVLGGVAVNEMIKQELKISDPTQLTKGFPHARYQQLIADMVAMADQDSGVA